MIIYIYYFLLFCNLLSIIAFRPTCPSCLFSRMLKPCKSIHHSSSSSILEKVKIFTLMAFDVSHGMDECDSVEDDLENISEETKTIKNDKEWMFFDVAKINVKGGDGGDGCMAMRREFRIAFGGPSGGNGGNGGSVYLCCNKQLNTLGMLRRRVHHRALDGTNGKGDSRHGKAASDVVIPVPPGTIVRNSEGVWAGELSTHGETLLVARGGSGGRGNEHFKTARMTAPAFAEKGEPGDERWLNLELKLVADVGLVGVPNAGKSTLLAACSNAKPKIADYPFTTVVPNLGVCDLLEEATDHKQERDETEEGGEDAPSLVLADIPGLLEGAHAGVGLGTAFLRHVQRCRVLVHVVSADSPDPLGDFRAINQELQLFNSALARKTQVVVLNKIDIPAARERLPELVRDIRREAGHTRVMGISAVTGENATELMYRVRRLVQLSRKRSADGEEENSTEENSVSFAGDQEEDKLFEVLREHGQFRVVGRYIEKVVSMTNWDYYEAVRRFQRILEAHGISQALRDAGAQQGDLVVVGDWEFSFWEPRNRWIAELGLEEVNPRHRAK